VLQGLLVSAPGLEPGTY